jgi:DNA-binding response OmpR family regulator
MADTTSPSEADTRARILVVDHDTHELLAMGTLLGLIGYHVEEADSLHKALMLLEAMPCDLLLLDPAMPGTDGGQLMRRARRMHPGLPIIVLTAHPTVESAITAVKVGATDYVLKPFDIENLANIIAQALQHHAQEANRQQLLDLVESTLRTLQRPGALEPAAPSPMPTAPGRFLHAGAITLDRQKRLAVVKGMRRRAVELTEGEAAILTALMERAEQVLSCRQLAHVAMGYELYEKQAESVVRPYIFRLRRKIEPSPRDPHLIRTVRGRGYFLSFRTLSPAASAV